MTRSSSFRATRLGYVGLVACVGVAVACGATNDSLFTEGAADGGEQVDEASVTHSFPTGDGSALDSGVVGEIGIDAAAIVITPANPVVTVNTGSAKPTVGFTASAGGQATPVSWSIDRGEIGTVDVKSGLFTPSGTVGGKATITANYRGVAVTTTVTVKIKATQNGDPAGTAADGGVDGGAGGWGGVGGEGIGLPTSLATKAVLDSAPVADPGLALLYPYDGTVWPRGLLAPLLQWDAPRSYDAVYIHVIEDNFEYQGYFDKTAASFVHHPLPQAIWEQLGYSNNGEDVTVSLVFAAGGKAYGPLTQKWKIAKGTLKGTVYYNSYGTDLVKNFGGPFGRFGAATLAIRPGQTAPTLVAGSSSATDGPGCRVCHAVSANGSTLLTNRFVPNDKYTSSYDLATKTETQMSPGDGRYSWPAISPDGTYLFSNAAPLQGSGGTVSKLYEIPDGGVIDAGGLPASLGAGTPVFSPDGKHVAFNFWGGAGADQKSLASLAFDPATKTFSDLKTLFTPGVGGKPGLKAWFPSFLPTNDSVVFHLEKVGNGGVAETRTGVRAELWWADLATKTSVRLDKLNGAGYLPAHPSAGAANAADDQSLNYEPTVNPVPSGGYAWVVFTSRRRYGNIAARNPFDSDPRYADLTKDPTPKKLWVAAIDLNAPSGADPSHPAFYLPAQELLAGNSRGYWVVDPCHSEGTGCVTGDECCGGYCRPGTTASSFVCSTEKPAGCVQEFDKCTTTADCCLGNGIACINNRCAQSVPPPAGPK